MNRLRLFLALGVAAWALSGCLIDPTTGERSLGQMITRDDELAIGREEHPRILRQFGGAYADAQIAAYVNGIGQNLAKVSELPELAFTFTVLNSPIVNAFALPGGYVYVTRGLLALAGSEAELASVLAHEIGHVTARHAAQRHQRAATVQVSARPGDLGTAGPKPGDLGQDPTAYVQGYSREQEMEADTLGIRYLARAGYDPQAMSSFLKKLDAHAKLEAGLMGLADDQTDQMSFTSTHPRTADRVDAAARRAGEVAAQASAAPQRGLNAEAYLKRIDGILYGDDPEQGFVRGSSFLHPKLLFRFDTPQGFRLFNSTQRVIGRNPGEAIILFDSAKRDPMTLPTMEEYLTRTWSRDLALTDVESIAIGGMPAATGWARVDTNRGARDLRLVAIQYDADTIYRFTYITPPGLTQTLAFDLRRSTYSFRTLTPDEAAALKPLRLRVAEVAPGDTVASLAAQLPLPDNREARLRALNGLGPEDVLQPGQPVKLVAE